ncbi:glycosyltransferase family 2 protein [Tropicibacter naphthalenivorans]|uniref:Glycosyl transferase family 2 n=1 Tax=Tropicibacter naphthalenivorans TaxID=441103 RepID=A0A0P1GSR8_9RHOB|nr:glycosyltransferase family 2 protein [Tropicibacter naphthalenivorans]CUH77632.1 hypothetical protein TRN7648_01576 [Tropicibacter naphthalenivorans]SMC54853.1 Glycosyl transferase family 2 [Tropicibacter naphthalenivorans]
MQTVAAALTMVRDDAFFLKAWLRHYGEVLGRENCYVVNHGRGAEVEQLAEGCNIIGIPGDPHPNFDMKRWRMLNNFVQGLRSYYTHVIVGDVDELVVVDPSTGLNLLDYLAKTKGKRVLTPLGLEVIHRPELEPEPITDRILGPRRHLRLAPHYSKPCVISNGCKIARGGHYTSFDELITPDELYLFHLKFCDFDNYVRVMDARNAVTQEIGKSIKETAIGRHWFPVARGDDRALFDGFAQLKMQEGFDVDWVRKRMHRSFTPRGDTGFFQFNRPEYDAQYVLPERFNGLF